MMRAVCVLVLFVANRLSSDTHRETQPKFAKPSQHAWFNSVVNHIHSLLNESFNLRQRCTHFYVAAIQYRSNFCSSFIFLKNTCNFFTPTPPILTVFSPVLSVWLPHCFFSPHCVCHQVCDVVGAYFATCWYVHIGSQGVVTETNKKNKVQRTVKHKQGRNEGAKTETNQHVMQSKHFCSPVVVPIFHTVRIFQETY